MSATPFAVQVDEAAAKTLAGLNQDVRELLVVALLEAAADPWGRAQRYHERMSPEIRLMEWGGGAGLAVYLIRPQLATIVLMELTWVG
ncbi:hypothetical protein [Kitasatospora purpeofusca]|uniref:hypothetical protein n=1 Tax=Kitasatospora purpeofusca TaxID=67352 RepID=UPI0036A4A979